MEINPVSDSSQPTEEDPCWKATGKFCWALSLCSASVAFFPAAAKKRRVYSLLAPAAAIEIQTAPEASPSETHLPPGSQTTAPPVPPASAEDRDAIREIFTTVAESDVGLLGHAIHLNALGAQLRNHRVHPFEFLKQAPKNSVRKIFLTSYPWPLSWIKDTKVSNVMGGVIEGMERERSNLERFLPAFARDMRKRIEELRPSIVAGRWQELVEILFDIKASPSLE